MTGEQASQKLDDWGDDEEECSGCLPILICVVVVVVVVIGIIVYFTCFS